jgi:hypothetical protein
LYEVLLACYVGVVTVTKTITERWEQGVAHDPRSIALYTSIARIDYEECGDSFGFKSGGDGDNGETLMYLFDVHFERKDKTFVVVIEEGTNDELLAAAAAIERIK